MWASLGPEVAVPTRCGTWILIRALTAMRRYAHKFISRAPVVLKWPCSKLVKRGSPD